MTRTNYCGQVTKDNLGQSVKLNGWVQKRRDLGGMIFIDLRDTTGIVQVVFNGEVEKELLEIAETLRAEYVVEIEGKVVQRMDGQINPNMTTGEIEIVATGLKVINEAKNE